MNTRENETSDEAPRSSFIHRHPWLIVMAVFLVLILAWTVLITIAGKNRPEKVPLEHRQEQAEP